MELNFNEAEITNTEVEKKENIVEEVAIKAEQSIVQIEEPLQKKVPENNPKIAAQINPEVDPIPVAHKSRVEIKPFNVLAKAGESLPELKKLFGNNVLEGNTVLFPAERGLGKSFLSLQLSIAISEGFEEYLGEKIELHGNTLYINMELGERIIMKRLAHLYKGVNKRKDNPYQAYCITARKNLDEVLNSIEAWIKKYKPVLIVIDNLRTAFGDLDNEKNKEMTKALTQLNNLRDKYGFALILVHHTKKGTSFAPTNSDLQSGAGAISDLVDGDFFLRKSQQDINLRILKRAKSRNCEDQDGAKLLRFNPETLWFEMVNENVNESDHIFFPTTNGTDLMEMKKEAERMRKEGKTFEEIGKVFGKDKSTASRWFKDKG